MNQWFTYLFISILLISNNILACATSSVFNQYCDVYEELILDDSMVSITDPVDKKKKKADKRKEFKEVVVTEQAKFFNGMLGKVHQINLPKSEVQFEFHRISELKKGIARANYLAVLKAKNNDKRKGQSRPLSQYEPHLQSIDLTLSINDNLGTDQFGILVTYDDSVSSNVSDSNKGKDRELPTPEEVESEDKIFLVDYAGNLQESQDLETALKDLKENSTKYYTLYLQKKDSVLPKKAPGIRVEKIQGWSMSQDLGTLKIRIPNGSHATGISFWGKSKITSSESLEEKNIGKSYLKGTLIKYSIEDLTYTVNVRGLQKLNKKNKTEFYIDPDADKSSCYDHVEPREREGYVAFNPFPNTPHGVSPVNSKNEEKITEDIATLMQERKNVIDNLDNEIKTIKSLEKNSKSSNDSLAKVIDLQEKLKFMPDFEEDSYKGTALVLDASGSMSGRPAEALKSTAIEALNKLPEGKEFAVFFQENDGVKKLSFDPKVSWKENKKNMIELITNFRIGGGDSEIIKPLLDVNNHVLNPEMKNISHVYVITDGYLGDYNEFQSALGQLKGTDKEFNVLQVGANYASKVSEKLQSKARDVKELDSKINKKKKAASRLILAQKVLDQRNPIKKVVSKKEIASSKTSDKKVKNNGDSSKAPVKKSDVKSVTPPVEKKIEIAKDGRFHEEMRVIKDPVSGKDKIEIKTTKGLKIITPGELKVMIKSFKKEIEVISKEKPKLAKKYDDEFSEVQNARKGDEELLNLLADMTGGARVPIGDLGNLEQRRRDAEAQEKKLRKNIQDINIQLQERELDDFSPQYIITLENELTQAKIDLTNDKQAAALKESRNPKINKQLKKLQEMEVVIGDMVKDWEEDVNMSKEKRDVKAYTLRVYVNKYLSYKEMLDKSEKK